MRIPNWINFLTYRFAKLFFHRWYYNQAVWQHTFYLGHRCMKAVSDLWNYQEILHGLKPSLIVELGTFEGGGTLFFSHTLRHVSPRSHVLSVDVNHDRIAPELRQEKDIEFLTASSVAPEVKDRIRALRREFPGPVFFILDSDHHRDHVLKEMEMLRDVTTKGDYVIVEDSNVNGHPVVHGFGPGPMEAINAYEERFPDDYRHDVEREKKFGFTFAPRGFLVRS